MIKRSNVIIFILTLIFITPFIFAWFAYSDGLFLKKHTVNHGTLIRPPYSIDKLFLTDEEGHRLPSKELEGKWWLLYVSASDCDKQCQQRLYYIRQIRQATGKDRDRIERGLVTLATGTNFNHWVNQNYPGMRHFIISPQSLALNPPSGDNKSIALTKSSLYLVDPHGNVMMFYAQDAAPKGILKDLERVLKVSQIG